MNKQVETALALLGNEFDKLNMEMLKQETRSTTEVIEAKCTINSYLAGLMTLRKALRVVKQIQEIDDGISTTKGSEDNSNSAA